MASNHHHQGDQAALSMDAEINNLYKQSHRQFELFENSRQTSGVRVLHVGTKLASYAHFIYDNGGNFALYKCKFSLYIYDHDMTIKKGQYDQGMEFAIANKMVHRLRALNTGLPSHRASDPILVVDRPEVFGITKIAQRYLEKHFVSTGNNPFGSNDLAILCASLLTEDAPNVVRDIAHRMPDLADETSDAFISIAQHTSLKNNIVSRLMGIVETVDYRPSVFSVDINDFIEAYTNSVMIKKQKTPVDDPKLLERELEIRKQIANSDFLEYGLEKKKLTTYSTNILKHYDLLIQSVVGLNSVSYFYTTGISAMEREAGPVPGVFAYMVAMAMAHLHCNNGQKFIFDGTRKCTITSGELTTKQRQAFFLRASKKLVRFYDPHCIRKAQEDRKPRENDTNGNRGRSPGDASSSETRRSKEDIKKSNDSRSKERDQKSTRSREKDALQPQKPVEFVLPDRSGKGKQTNNNNNNPLPPPPPPSKSITVPKEKEGGEIVVCITNDVPPNCRPDSAHTEDSEESRGYVDDDGYWCEYTEGQIEQQKSRKRKLSEVEEVVYPEAKAAKLNEEYDSKEEAEMVVNAEAEALKEIMSLMW